MKRIKSKKHGFGPFTLSSNHILYFPASFVEFKCAKEITCARENFIYTNYHNFINKIEENRYAPRINVQPKNMQQTYQESTTTF